MIKFDNKKVQYFVDSFTYILNHEDSTEILLNPHIILLYIIDDLKYGSNERNLKFWYEKILKFFYIDPIYRKSDFLIKQLLEHINSEREYALQLAYKLIEENQEYAQLLCDHIYAICFNQDDLSDKLKKEICYLSKALYLEFVLKGYSEERLKRIFDELFDHYISDDNIDFYTFFPFLPKSLEAIEDKITFMEQLTENIRLGYLKDYFSLPICEYWYICGIEGIFGENLDITIGDVSFYNVETCKKFKIDKDDIVEKIQFASLENFSEVKNRVAVKVQTIDYENVRNIAIDKIQQAIDVICNIHKFKIPLYIDNSREVILDDEENINRIGSSIKEEAVYRKIRGINYNIYSEEHIDNFNKLYEDYSNVLIKNNTMSIMMKDSMRWYRKGEEAKTWEDKLLYYWISLENLISEKIEIPDKTKNLKNNSSKFAKIYCIVPNLFLTNYIFDYLWEVFYFIRSRYFSIGISDELATKCDLKNYKEYNLLNFIKNIDMLINEINNEFDKDIVIELKKKIDNKGISLINDILEEKRDNLMLAYRMRNMIVHNAKTKIEFSDNNINCIKDMVHNMYIFYLNELKRNDFKSENDIIYSRYIEQCLLVNVMKETEFIEWLKIFET